MRLAGIDGANVAAQLFHFAKGTRGFGEGDRRDDDRPHEDHERDEK